MAAAYVFVGAVSVLSYLNEHPEVRTALRDETLHAASALRRSRFTLGPALDWDALTRDVAAANHALASLATEEGRFVVGVAHRGRARAFLRALRFSPAVAGLLGDVQLDVEWRGRGERDGDDDEEVVSAVQRCDLLQAYTFLFPALQQLARDAAALPVEPVAERESDAAECCICFTAPVDCISPCAHGFCSDCYHRWRRQDAGCALCRSPLPASERWGMGSYLLIDKSETPSAVGADGVGVTQDSVLAWLRGLPRACEPE